MKKVFLVFANTLTIVFSPIAVPASLILPALDIITGNNPKFAFGCWIRTWKDIFLFRFDM